jgi:hypothetical protein
MSPNHDYQACSLFHSELACAEAEISASSIDWAVREADLERRLLQLRDRVRTLQSAAKDDCPAPRNAVALYTTRWSHHARQSLSLA